MAALSPTLWAAGFLPVLDTGAHAWGDFNNDGWPDLFDRSAVWTNNGDGTFTHSRPLEDLARVSNVTLADYNNDGFIDAYGYKAGEDGEGGPRL
ncbi:MAG: VCBS repeat-containing protein, partial [Akkermansiaceae bacterium]|nr:VCBS repeat-containing protein [Akkermansiaceae bacterium]